MTPTEHSDAGATQKPNQGLDQVEDTGLVEGADAGFEQETGPQGDTAAENAPTHTFGRPKDYDLGRLLDGSDKGPVGGPPDSADAYGAGQDEGSID